MIEFTLVSIAVVAVVATNWHRASRWQMGVGGLLSFTLGLRIAALVTAGYLLPGVESLLAAQEPEAAAVEAGAAEKAAAKGTTESEAKPSPAGSEASQPENSDTDKPESAIDKPTLPKLGDAGKQGSTKVEKDEADPATASVTQLPASGRSEGSEKPAMAFVSKVVYLTPNRPSWLESVPTYEGDVYKVAVKAGPYQTVRDCLPDLDREISLAVTEFINDHLRAPHASKFVHYSPKELRARNVIREQFSEQLETSVGLMSQVHTQLVFDNSFRDELEHRWSDIKANSRLAQSGLGVGIVLLFLGTMFSFLKLDTATRGYYTGRLQFVAAATILALVAASVLLMKWIPWM